MHHVCHLEEKRKEAPMASSRGLVPSSYLKCEQLHLRLHGE
ncbi:hypothetical protein DB31_0283 [Hyalangium minutum]|uniref:Uncharacterized protein n=1 Tax=Hyalangium minutum TaxID=394096 RepID=A0A085WWF9_9BACT|nr:hypothetical protein DB31_0283 [Hyalangium minutum]